MIVGKSISLPTSHTITTIKQRNANSIMYSIFFGKTKIMAKALGTTPETSHLEATHKLSKYLTGNVGLLLTNRAPSEIIEHFSTFSTTDYARAGTTAPRDFTIPAGVVYSRGGEIDESEDVVLSHSIEPELRRLGLPTSLTKGKISLQNPYEVCKEGKVLDSRQTRLLKLFGVAFAEFRIRLVAYWSAESQEVVEVEAEGDEEMEE